MIEDRIRTLEREHFARHRVTWSERFLDVDAGVRIRVLELGNGAPIICLHAASWFAAHWAELSASLPGHRLCSVIGGRLTVLNTLILFVPAGRDVFHPSLQL